MLHDATYGRFGKLRRSEDQHGERLLEAGSDGRRCLPGARTAASPHDRSEP